MGRRKQNATKGFQLVEKKYTELLNKLKECKSFGQLDRILKDYEKKKQKSYYDIPSNLTENQHARIGVIKQGIKQLIAEKEKAFSPSLFVEAQSLESSSGSTVELQVTEELVTKSEIEHTDESAKEQLSSVSISEIQVKQVKEEDDILLETPHTEPKKAHVKKPQVRFEEVRLDLREKLQPLFEERRAKEMQSQQTLQVNEVSVFDEPIKESAVEERIQRERRQHLLKVIAQLKVIRDKHKELKAEAKEYLSSGKIEDAERYSKAAEAAKNIHNAISRLSKQYIQDGDLEFFKSESKLVLREDKADVQTLQEHRGWKLILTNLAAFVFTAGLAHAGYSLYRGSFSIFEPATDSSKKVAELHESINTVSLTA